MSTHNICLLRNKNDISIFQMTVAMMYFVHTHSYLELLEIDKIR